MSSILSCGDDPQKYKEWYINHLVIPSHEIKNPFKIEDLPIIFEESTFLHAFFDSDNKDLPRTKKDRKTIFSKNRARHLCVLEDLALGNESGYVIYEDVCYRKTVFYIKSCNKSIVFNKKFSNTNPYYDFVTIFHTTKEAKERKIKRNQWKEVL